MKKPKSTLATLAARRPDRPAQPMVKAVGCGICWASSWAPFVAACTGPPPYSQVL